jgi:hypothetical protein
LGLRIFNPNPRNLHPVSFKNKEFGAQILELFLISSFIDNPRTFPILIFQYGGRQSKRDKKPKAARIKESKETRGERITKRLKTHI